MDWLSNSQWEQCTFLFFFLPFGSYTHWSWLYARLEGNFKFFSYFSFLIQQGCTWAPIQTPVRAKGATITSILQKNLLNHKTQVTKDCKGACQGKTHVVTIAMSEHYAMPGRIWMSRLNEVGVLRQGRCVYRAPHPGISSVHCVKRWGFWAARFESGSYPSSLLYSRHFTVLGLLLQWEAMFLSYFLINGTQTWDRAGAQTLWHIYCNPLHIKNLRYWPWLVNAQYQFPEKPEEPFCRENMQGPKLFQTIQERSFCITYQIRSYNQVVSFWFILQEYIY